MFSAILVFVIQDTPFPTEVCDLPESAVLVYRGDGGGFAYFSNNKLTLVSQEGRHESTNDIPVGVKPLFFQEDRGVISSSESLLTSIDLPTGRERGVQGLSGSFFASRDAVFFVSGGLTLIDPRGGLHFARFGSYSSAAASEDFKTIASMYCNGVDPTLEVAKWVDGEWLKSNYVRLPEVDRVGSCSVIRQRRDLVFISEDLVAFIGEFVGAVDKAAYDEMYARIPDFTKWPFEPKLPANFRPSDVDCFLFVMRISDGLTFPYGRFSYQNTAERRSAGGFGLMVPSSDGKSLFLAVNEKVLRFDTEKLKKLF
jgi:hypothetical protein